MVSNIILIGKGIVSDIDYNLVINHNKYDINIIMTKKQHKMIYSIIKSLENERNDILDNDEFLNICIKEIIKIIWQK